MKSVKVHDDTHRALKALKASRRSASIDQVIREMIKASTGAPVGRGERLGSEELTKYLGP
ncbi:MAG: hypothetical protein JRN16_02660 [Nitrososphaerota archaeon]|nr:hypothetical protein [Nitrososphaerota archaeon]MDG6963922.1 hypothetical protein [Nitrososphaerota archaeon]MDG6974635.1 hypothetical protein [Nitrososphaerota archaeon]MDG7027292.1 hypothetical protein [Nitrososphaerota archaeon]MDG7030852.1 hypothetical protein [Nitrososphaerota archaeon]